MKEICNNNGADNRRDSRVYRWLAYESGCRALHQSVGMPGVCNDCRWSCRDRPECREGGTRFRLQRPTTGEADGRENLYRFALSELAASRVEQTKWALLLLIDGERPYPPALFLSGLLAWVEGETWMAEHCLDSYIQLAPESDMGWLLIETLYGGEDPVALWYRQVPPGCGEQVSFVPPPELCQQGRSATEKPVTYGL